MCVSLVLEGGGTRCAYTSGVLDVLMDNNLFMQRTYAVSAGAYNALSYLSKQRGRSFRIFYEFIRDKRCLSYGSLRKNGSMCDFDFIFGELSHELIPFDYKEFFKTKMELHVGTTDCETGRSVFFDNSQMDEKFTAVIASSSSPLASPIVKFGGKQLLNGGITSPIPIEQALTDGYTRNIVVMTSCRDDVKAGKPDLPKIIMQSKFKKYPQLIEAMIKRSEVYNLEKRLCNELEENGHALIIAPSKPISVGQYERNPEKLKEIYDMGIADAKAALQKVQRFIALNN